MAYELVAAVDLGSNSFRLQVGRVVDDQIYPLDALKEPVRLASGLTADKRLDAASRARALLALRRFGERLRGFAPDAVRAVATNTLRVARDAPEFIPLAEKALGFPIEVIGGREEARLIYLGVAHSLPAAEHKRLVFDIGGGSTEFIIGRQVEPLLLESLYMGCVSYTLRFFPGGLVDKKRFREAELAAAREIQRIATSYRQFGWQEAVGSSGTARALADILELNGLNPGGVSGVTRAGLERLRSLLIRAGSAEALAVEGLRPDRMPVFVGGLAIMCAIFSEMGVEHMTYADGALRLGVLYDLLGRFFAHDMRDATVQQFMRRYQVDGPQAERVARTAHGLFAQLVDAEAPEHENDFRFLRWAAQLHEIGISVAHSGYHKHGAYVLTFADMPGFSKKEQSRLALLVLGQRGKLEKLSALPPQDSAWLLVLCLRLAVQLHRSRDDGALPKLALKRSASGFQLEVPADWFANNPLKAVSLNEEAAVWERIGSSLRIRRRATAPEG